MVTNIELEKSYSFILRIYDGPSSSLRKSVVNAYVRSNCSYVWHDEPNQIMIAMSSDKPRPAKIYLIQLCAQQRRISDCTDAHSNQNLSCPLQ